MSSGSSTTSPAGEHEHPAVARLRDELRWEEQARGVLRLVMDGLRYGASGQASGDHPLQPR